MFNGGGTIPHLAFLMWIPLAVLLASTVPRRVAFMIIVFGGVMYLPQKLKLDLPLLPPMDKAAMSCLLGWVLCWWFIREPGDEKARLGASKIFAGLIAFNAFMTLLMNRDPATFGVVTKSGLTFSDGFALTLTLLMLEAIPFFMGQAIFRRPDDLRLLIRGLTIAALIYVPLVLYEARMSPQLHRSFYGYFQHSWAQMVRDGAFRAIVFMSHGLSVAFMMSQGAIASAGIARIKSLKLPIPTFIATVLLGGALFSCLSWASIIYACIGVPLMWWTTAKMQLRAARYIAYFVLSYPMLHILGWLDTDWVVAQFAQYSEDRAASLDFRFNNETVLLEHARERFFFGWGGYGRNRVFDPESGVDLTVIDGEWIGRLGTGGFSSFAVFFFTLLFPIFRASKAVKVAQPDDARTLAVTAFLIAVTGLDFIPNAMSHPIPLILAGALLGTSNTILESQNQRVPTAPRRVAVRQPVRRALAPRR